jgi:Protein of unknown function (DUF2723)
MTTVTRAARVAAPLVVAAIAIVLTRPTMLPGLGFWDTAEFQTVGPLLGTAHPTGFPAYVVLGWLSSILLLPFGDPALRMNLLSVLLVAAAAGLTVVLVRLLTGWTAIAVAAGIGLVSAPIAWKIATRADPHALHLALLALLLVCLVAWAREHRDAGRERWLLAASVVYGVSLANHSLTLLLAPAVGLYVLAVYPRIVLRGRLIVACALLVAGSAALLYLELPLRAGLFRAPLVYGTPNTFDGFRYIVLAEQFQGSLSDPFDDLPKKFATLVELTDAQFGFLTPFIPAALLATVVSAPRYALLSGLATLITCFFNASYANADISRYYLGPLLFAWTWLAILAGVALNWIATGGPAPEAPPATESEPESSRAPRLPVPAVLGLVVGALLLAPTLAALPGREKLVDVSKDDGARRWVESVVTALQPDAVVVSWWSYSTPLWYVQRVEQRRWDITIDDDRTRLDEHLGEVRDVIDAHLGRQPVYVVVRGDGEMRDIRARYALAAVDGTGNSLFIVTGLAGSAP